MRGGARLVRPWLGAALPVLVLVVALGPGAARASACVAWSSPRNWLEVGVDLVRDEIRTLENVARRPWEIADELDERIEDLQGEIAEGRDAALRKEQIVADIQRLQLEWDDAPAARAVPCEVDVAALLGTVRRLVEPLGVQVMAQVRPSRKEFYWELPVIVWLPDREGAAAEVSAALRASGRLLMLAPAPLHAQGAIIVQFKYACEALTPRLRDYREPPWGRDGVVWPFDAGIAWREREIVRLQEERDRHADSLLLVGHRRQLSEAIERRQAILEDLVRRASPVP